METFFALKELIISGELIEQLITSIGRMIMGLCLGLTSAFICGLLAGKFAWIYETFRPIYSLLLGIPPVILVVLAMVWFGTGATVPVFVVAFLVFPTMFINTADGFKNIDKQLIEMADIYRNSSFKKLRHVIIPSLYVPVISALSLAIGSAVRITIMAELLGASSGMGYSIALARVNINTDTVFAWTIVCIIIILVVDTFIIQPLKNYVLRWNAG